MRGKTTNTLVVGDLRRRIVGDLRGRSAVAFSCRRMQGAMVEADRDTALEHKCAGARAVCAQVATSHPAPPQPFGLIRCLVQLSMPPELPLSARKGDVLDLLGRCDRAPSAQSAHHSTWSCAVHVRQKLASRAPNCRCLSLGSLHGLVWLVLA